LTTTGTTKIPADDLAERERRLKRLRELMRGLGFDGIIASDVNSSPLGYTLPRYCRYISAFHIIGGASQPRQPVVIVPLEGEPTLVVPPGMVGSWATLAQRASWISNVVSSYSDEPGWELRTRWGLVADLAADVTHVLEKSGLERGRIGVAGTWAGIDDTKAALPNARFEPTLVLDDEGRPRDLLGPLIGANSPWEIRKLELAQVAANLTVNAFIDAARAGATIRETAVEAKVAAMRAGVENIMLMGSVGVEPWAFWDWGHAAPDDPFKQGKMYCLEVAQCVVDGYLVQVARSFVAGPPSKAQKSLFDAVKRALDATLNAVEIGRTGEELWEIGMSPIREAGFEAWGRFGHYMGFEFLGPQRINLLPGDTHALYEGQVVTIHPTVVDKAAGNFVIEGDTILVEENGWRFLSAQPPVHELTSI
jgi:Xaa-Pro aminopeptidase